jgi:hypothetical protein
MDLCKRQNLKPVEPEFKNTASEAEQKNPAMWAKIGGSSWYAIPPGLADSFRKAGAEVRQAHELPK